MASQVHLGTVIGAHGVRGEVRVKTFTARPDALGAYGPLHAADGRVFMLRALRPAGEGEAVAAFEGIADRNTAETLKGMELFVERAALPAPAAEEFYHADLIGLAAEDEEGRRIGRITAIQNFGASDVLEIAREDGGDVLIAFTRENVPVIDIASGRIVVAVPEEVEARAKGTVE